MSEGLYKKKSKHWEEVAELAMTKLAQANERIEELEGRLNDIYEESNKVDFDEAHIRFLSDLKR